MRSKSLPLPMIVRREKGSKKPRLISWHHKSTSILEKKGCKQDRLRAKSSKNCLPHKASRRTEKCGEESQINDS